MDYSLSDSSVQAIFQARILEQIAISYSRGSSGSKDQNRNSCISCIGRQVLYHYATQEALLEAEQHLLAGRNSQACNKK